MASLYLFRFHPGPVPVPAVGEGMHLLRPFLKRLGSGLMGEEGFSEAVEDGFASVVGRGVGGGGGGGDGTGV